MSMPQTTPMPLDTTSGMPLYRQIVVILTNRLNAGTLRPGDVVPGEAAVCAEFGVSRITARRALNELAAMGRVVRERGKGTRVLPFEASPAAMKASLDGLLENVGHMGRVTTVKVLETRNIPATAEVAEMLELEEGAVVQRAVRVRALADAPMSYLVTIVPKQIATQIEGQDLSRTPLLLLLEEAGVQVASATQTISATVADAEVAHALTVPAGSPLIEVNRLVRDADNRPVEMIRVLYRPELYRFEITMRRVTAETGRTWESEAPDHLRSL
ncbi:GntR family transcriptional regulator [Sulfitobacter aestuariivivens]|uniref:GntR family transcriptional regulator n=1 Tax=Sulfitobacter aestuariivivens TaxID=2766981 RepID=A0A927D316_9RHOB|nr:GntR family transcriptional regulator [Sulfitobacter aestuariivivens]MBD3662352.1 GntR family transcriptional regulator [Sulfitobacter aestuariivivens]